MVSQPAKIARRAAWATGFTVTIGAAFVPLLWPLVIAGAVLAALTLRRSGQVLFSMQMADFREYDLHFLTAIMINAGQNFQLSVSCQNSGGKACTPMVMISGTNAGS